MSLSEQFVDRVHEVTRAFSETLKNHTIESNPKRLRHCFQELSDSLADTDITASHPVSIVQSFLSRCVLVAEDLRTCVHIRWTDDYGNDCEPFTGVWVRPEPYSKADLDTLSRGVWVSVLKKNKTQPLPFHTRLDQRHRLT